MPDAAELEQDLPRRNAIVGRPRRGGLGGTARRWRWCCGEVEEA
jgi:hypothetical protein